MTDSPKPVTLITGATGGIGAALARELAGTHDLILQARDGARLSTLCAEVGGTPLPLDLTRPDTFEAALSGLGRVTNVVQNAGVADLGAVAEQPPEVWTHTLAVNVVAPAALTRLLLPRVRAERGTVVFVNSGAGLRANPGWASYAASKFALRALADALREEEVPHGVRVTSVYPGRTATPMQEKVRSQEGGAYDPEVYVSPETVAATVRFVLEAPRDATLPDVSVRPGPR
ncbi:SDR family oxidoreductase [Deinococcus metallilatus]|uniref:NADP-dependent 3-hydroxy acid dehydrogenase YdfG n=1 Tax=Deinococcus metallilatus TaxID=1211322 RepID=A0AAJ5F567_9DEIO|nr:SDR family oxidoreductase [Deinococcus metallilatus]MBB5294282.1 NADP-dependent 3-hydroxy acid dehydrogenase YdfG [Deinococcus metallilatus]QBY09057.1 SDR family oxidoreductase [Deinococcus metallilatus]RXJ10201.1 SDR family oxidoreductase [Deinococcus metallilatus]TLK27862.1 SDR family oxidoreductase [Deinococcus metallilatus]GMA16382.1 short chain dehydrogenase [Deinococcus metallilatus]